jgi:hypothetical protein
MIGQSQSLRSLDAIALIEAAQGCKADFVRSVTVRQRRNEQVIWESVIHVFDLKGHPDADRLYLRSEEIEGFDSIRTSVLRLRFSN